MVVVVVVVAAWGEGGTGFWEKQPDKARRGECEGEGGWMWGGSMIIIQPCVGERQRRRLSLSLSLADPLRDGEGRRDQETKDERSKRYKKRR
jgi:hypothetical protein